MISYDRLMESWRTEGHRLSACSHMALAEQGVVLGAETVIVKAARDCWLRPVLKIDGQEERILALLSAAYWRPVSPKVLGSLRTASRCWSKGELTQAALHLAFTGLPALPDGDAAPRRLFMVDRLLKAGMAEEAVLSGLELLPPGISGEGWRKWTKYTADQPRDEHGR